MDELEAIKVTFFQECEELLADLEGGLLAMQEGAGDLETVNAVFRAVHSIKGGAGAFGFERLQHFTHHYETVLDMLRSGQLALTSALLDVLVGAFDRARASFEPQLVTVVGVPGIGKSRLVGELFQRIGELPDLIWWRQGRALPYGEGVTYWPLAAMIKDSAGITDDAPASEAFERLRLCCESEAVADLLAVALGVLGGGGIAGLAVLAGVWQRFGNARHVWALFTGPGRGDTQVVLRAGDAGNEPGCAVARAKRAAGLARTRATGTRR